jgi:hypothetical protein
MAKMTLARATEVLNEHRHMGLAWSDDGSGWAVGRSGSSPDVCIPEAVAVSVADDYHGGVRVAPVDAERIAEAPGFIPVEVGYERRVAYFYVAKPVPCGACGSDHLGLDREYTPNFVRTECYECGACGPWAEFGFNEPSHGEETKAAIPWNKMWARIPPAKGQPEDA